MTNFKHLNLINSETCENLKKLCDYYETTDFYSRFDETVKKLNLDIDPANQCDMIFNLSLKYLIHKVGDKYSITSRSGMNNLDLKVVDLYSRIIFKMQTCNSSDNEEDQYIEFMGAKFKECNSCRESIANIPDYYIDYDVDPIDEICNKLKDQFMVYFSLSNRKINSIRVLAIKRNRDVLFTVLIDE